MRHSSKRQKTRTKARLHEAYRTRNTTPFPDVDEPEIEDVYDDNIENPRDDPGHDTTTNINEQEQHEQPSDVEPLDETIDDNMTNEDTEMNDDDDSDDMLSPSPPRSSSSSESSGLLGSRDALADFQGADIPLFSIPGRGGWVLEALARTLELRRSRSGGGEDGVEEDGDGDGDEDQDQDQDQDQDGGDHGDVHGDDDENREGGRDEGVNEDDDENRQGREEGDEERDVEEDEDEEGNEVVCEEEIEIAETESIESVTAIEKRAQVSKKPATRAETRKEAEGIQTKEDRAAAGRGRKPSARDNAPKVGTRTGLRSQTAKGEKAGQDKLKKTPAQSKPNITPAEGNEKKDTVEKNADQTESVTGEESGNIAFHDGTRFCNSLQEFIDAPLSPLSEMDVDDMDVDLPDVSEYGGGDEGDLVEGSGGQGEGGEDGGDQQTDDQETVDQAIGDREVGEQEVGNQETEDQDTGDQDTEGQQTEGPQPSRQPMEGQPPSSLQDDDQRTAGSHDKGENGKTHGAVDDGGQTADEVQVPAQQADDEDDQPEEHEGDLFRKTYEELRRKRRERLERQAEGD